MAEVKENEPLLIVKAGGSALTKKSVLETLNADSLERISGSIAALTSRGFRIVLIHGAGSFGHFQAKTYALSHGGRQQDWCEGLAGEAAGSDEPCALLTTDPRHRNSPLLGLFEARGGIRLVEREGECSGVPCISLLDQVWEGRQGGWNTRMSTDLTDC